MIMLTDGSGRVSGPNPESETSGIGYIGMETGWTSRPGESQLSGSSEYLDPLHSLDPFQLPNLVFRWPFPELDKSVTVPLAGSGESDDIPCVHHDVHAVAPFLGEWYNPGEEKTGGLLW